MNSTSSVIINRENVCQKEPISDFFEKHATTRKIIAYIPPIFLGMVYTIERLTACKVLPTNGFPLAVAVVFFFSGIAESCERSLKNKTIEHLNA